MSDQPDRSAEPERIRVHEEQDLRRWAQKLNATPEQLKEAVQAVGDRSDEVEAHLKGVRSSTNSERVAREMSKG